MGSRLYCVVTRICWTRGIGDHGVDVEDWPSHKAADAREFARETSCCADVDLAVFENPRNQKPQVFVSGEKVKCSLII